MKKYQTSVPAAAAAYASSGYEDDLTMSAIWLAIAANSTDRYAEAGTYFDKFKLAGSNAVFNWDSVTPGIPILFSQIANAEPGLVGAKSNKWQTESERYLDNIANHGSPTRLTSGMLDTSLSLDSICLLEHHRWPLVLQR